jgi:hypothetical protein
MCMGNTAPTAHQQIKQAAITYGWTIGGFPADRASERDSHWVLAKPGRNSLNVTFAIGSGERRAFVADVGTQSTWDDVWYGFTTGGGRLAKALTYLAATDEDAHLTQTVPPVPRYPAGS